MKKFNLVLFGLMAFSTLFLTACNSDDDNAPSVEETGEFANGVFILNEGGYGNGNSSLSFLSDAGVLQNNVYENINGELLGDTAQCLYADEDRLFIVLNGSGTIEVVDRYTLEKIGTVSTGISNPRYFLIEHGKGIDSNWGDPTNPADDFIAVIDLTSYSVTSTIPVVEGPERMVAENGKIYVAHSGGWNYGNQISVINASSLNVSAEIPVGDVPNSLEIANNKLYVLCGGIPAWTGNETLGEFQVIDIQSNATILSLDFPESQHPANLKISGNELFYTVDSDVFNMEANPNV